MTGPVSFTIKVASWFVSCEVAWMARKIDNKHLSKYIDRSMARWLAKTKISRHREGGQRVDI